MNATWRPRISALRVCGRRTRARHHRRQLCRQHGASTSTVLLACPDLENRALPKARPKSGQVLAAHHEPLPAPEIDPRRGHAGLAAADDPLAAPSDGPMAARSLLPKTRLHRLPVRLNRLHPEYASSRQIAGSAAVRQEIARRRVSAGVRLRPDGFICKLGLRSIRTPTHPPEGRSLETPHLATQTPGAATACVAIPTSTPHAAP